MALALTAYELSLCPGCGLPASKVHGDHNVGRYETHEHICHGCEVIESLKDQKQDTYPGKKIGLVEVDGFDN